MNHGIKISLPGFNVLKAKDNQLLFTSKYPALKIHSEGAGSYNFTNNEGRVTVTTHNLGYRPFFVVWVDEGSGYNLCTVTGSVGDFFTAYMATSTTTTLELVAIATYTGGFFGDPTPPPNKNVSYRWKIFYDPVKNE